VLKDNRVGALTVGGLTFASGATNVVQITGVMVVERRSVDHAGAGDACRKFLDARGDDSNGWALAWRMNLWARLGDGKRTTARG